VAAYIALIIDWTWWALLGPLFVLGIVVGLGIVGLVLTLIIEGVKKAYRHFRPELEPKEKGDRTLSLVGAFLKARKERYCPLIEIVGDEEEA
jgi:hypothetical protein